MTQTATNDTTDSTRAKWLDLSLTQLIGGSMAAATAAYLGSRLGLLGTIAGAAIGSLVSATAASLYIGSLHRARAAILAARSLAPPTRISQPGLLPWRPLDRIGARRLLATTGLVFAVAAAFLTGLQLASGTNLTGTTVGTRAAIIEPPAMAPAQPAATDTSHTAPTTPADGADPVGATGSATGTPAPGQPTAGATTPPAAGSAAAPSGSPNGSGTGATSDAGVPTTDPSPTGDTGATATPPAAAASPTVPIATP